MMIDLKYVLYVMLSFITIGGAIVKFFQMQTKQNMRLEQMEKDQQETHRKASKQTEFQIQTEKDIITLDSKIDKVDDKVTMILDLMKDLKEQGCGRCLDKT